MTTSSTSNIVIHIDNSGDDGEFGKCTWSGTKEEFFQTPTDGSYVIWENDYNPDNLEIIQTHVLNLYYGQGIAPPIRFWKLLLVETTPDEESDSDSDSDDEE